MTPADASLQPLARFRDCKCSESRAVGIRVRSGAAELTFSIGHHALISALQWSPHNPWGAPNTRGGEVELSDETVKHFVASGLALERHPSGRYSAVEPLAIVTCYRPQM